MSNQEKLLIEDIANPEEIQLLSNLECPIDNMISINSFMCKKCETIFCQDCIENWKNKSKVCPMRCNPIELISVDKTIIKSQLNKIKLFCKYQSQGCFEKILIQDMVRHEKICDFRPAKCEKCQEQVPISMINSHIFENCHKNTIKCIICYKDLTLREFTLHLEVCMSNPICINCGSYEANHQVCELKLIECPQCSFPDFNADFIHNRHRCVEHSDINSQNYVINIQTYYKYLYSKFENYIYTSHENSEKCNKEFNLKLNEMSTEIYKRETEKCSGLESKYNFLLEEANKKIFNIKKDKNNNLNKLKIEIKVIEGQVEGIKYIILYFI